MKVVIFRWTKNLFNLLTKKKTYLTFFILFGEKQTLTHHKHIPQRENPNLPLL